MHRASGHRSPGRTSVRRRTPVSSRRGHSRPSGPDRRPASRKCTPEVAAEADVTAVVTGVVVAEGAVATVAVTEAARVEATAAAVARAAGTAIATS